MTQNITLFAVLFIAFAALNLYMILSNGRAAIERDRHIRLLNLDCVKIDHSRSLLLDAYIAQVRRTDPTFLTDRDDCAVHLYDILSYGTGRRSEQARLDVTMTHCTPQFILRLENETVMISPEEIREMKIVKPFDWARFEENVRADSR